MHVEKQPWMPKPGTPAVPVLPVVPKPGIPLEPGLIRPFPPRPVDPMAQADRAAHAMMDVNADGQLNRDEWVRSGRPEDTFDAYDRNGDGAVSADEYVAGRKAEREFRKKDVNGDGVLSPLEYGFSSLKDLVGAGKDLLTRCFPSHPGKPTFAKLDANGDGQISASEYVAGSQQPQTPWHRPLPMPRPLPGPGARPSLVQLAENVRQA